MKIEFLGTGAAEGIPALFCKCEKCEHARNAGGKNIRLRTGVLIDRRLLMDFSPDAFVQSLYRKIDYSGLHALLVTHTHSDHFAMDDLVQRSTCNSRNRTVPVLKVLGSRMMCAKLEDAVYDDDAAKSMSLTALTSGQSAQVGDYRITAWKTVHMETEDSLIYLISCNGKQYLHAVDSAELTQEVYDDLWRQHIHLDGVSLDCTFGLLEEEYYGHMNFRQNLKVKKRLEEIGAADAHTRFFLMHISHYAGNTHEELEKAASPHGFEVAYDGMCVSL